MIPTAIPLWNPGLLFGTRTRPEPKVLQGYSAVIDTLEAVVKKKPGALIYMGQHDFADLDDHIFDNAERLTSARFFQLLSRGGKPGGRWGTDPWNHPDIKKHLLLTTAFCGPASRGCRNFLHLHLDEVPHLFDTAEWSPDVAIVAISPTDDQGYVTLGPDAGLSYNAVRRAKIRIGIQNHYGPRFARNSVLSKGTFLKTGCAFEFADFDYVVRVFHAFADGPAPELTDEVKRMGRAIAKLTPNGTVLQAGIGSGLISPDNMLNPEFYQGHEGLRSFAELVGPKAAELAMQQDAGDIWAGFVAGPGSYLKRLDREGDIGRRFNILPVEQMVDTAFIVRHCGGRLNSLAGALAVDAHAAVASAALGPRMFSGVGGAFRYADAAIKTGGECIVVMPATYTDKKEGTKSRIMSMLPRGTPASLSVRMVSRICTENGITDDFHRMLAPDRAACMVGLAAPMFREELIREIKSDYGYTVDPHRAVDMVAFDRLGV